MSGLNKLQNTLEAIYAETPQFFPYGLKAGDHYESLYNIYEKNASINKDEPVGFVGWQVIKTANNNTVGLYVIGIKPEYRGNRYAEEAIEKVINIKKATVDRCVAFIAEGNEPSIKLAKKLGIDVYFDDKALFRGDAPDLKFSKSAASRVSTIKNLLKKYPEVVGALGGAAAGAGLTAVEQPYLKTEEMKHIMPILNLLGGLAVGTAGGYAGRRLLKNPNVDASTLVAGGSTLAAGMTLKNVLGFLGDSFIHRNQTEADLADAREAAALAEERAAGSAERASENTSDALKLLAGAGLLGGGYFAGEHFYRNYGEDMLENAGDYLKKFLFSKEKEKSKSESTKRKMRTTTVKKSPGRRRSKSKIKIDIPADSLPDSFFQSLINVDDGSGAVSKLRAPEVVNS